MSKIGASKKWPDTVPILTAKDFTCHSYADSDGTRCLLGWARGVFGPKVYDRENEDVIADHYDGNLAGPIVAVVNELITATRSEDAEGVARYNDHSTPATCARVWNKTMAKLGYTEPAGDYK